MFDFILHIDKHLAAITSTYGVWTYAILFLIIFAETGLVVAPLLPGDSLLFAAGALCSLGNLDVGLLMILLFVAAVLGDSLNYAIGKRVGEKLFTSTTSKFLNRKHLDRAHAFYERYGGKTIILARFMPIVRTFAPFVAGIGSMTYGKFFLYNVVGAALWVGSFSMLGYLFAQQPIVKNNFTLVVLAIIVVSIIPAVVEIVRVRMRREP
ncbi:MAG: DedA family protein [bacterium]|nr:DedA family protein [bacterium]